MRTAAAGASLATLTAVVWGGQFVVGKSALGSVDAFHLNALRYGMAAFVLLAVLAAVEGRHALRLDGRGLRLLWLGTVGFAGFNLLAYVGLEHARPESAALIVAMAPLLTALLLWLRTRVRPARATLVSLWVALAGVALVISRGDPASIVNGSIGWGDALVLGGVLSFVIYTLGASELEGFSPLRFTALTAGLGWIAIAGAASVATVAGLEPEPSARVVWSIAPQLAYLALLGAVVAVLSWNTAIGKIGPQNTALFGTLIPVTTFVIEIVRGYRPGPLELGGAALTVGALAAGNILARRKVPAVRRERVEMVELAEAA